MQPVYLHPLPLKTLHNHFFNFSWVLTVVPGEIDDNCYEFSFFWGGGGGGRGQTRCIMAYVKMVNNNSVWMPTIDILI